MKLFIFSLLLIGGLVSCSNNDSNGSNKNEKKPKEVQTKQDSLAYVDSLRALDSLYTIDSLNAQDSINQAHRELNELDLKILNKYLEPTSVAHLVHINQLGNVISEDGGFLEMHNAYVNETDPLKLKGAYRSAPDYEIIEQARRDFQSLGRKLHGIEITCVAECTELAFIIKFSVWDSLAKITDTPIDNEYVKLNILADGDYGHGEDYGFKTWFMAMCDYGGSTIIGDGIAFNFLKAYDAFLAKNTDFEMKWLNNLRSVALHNAHTHRSHMRTAEKITEELVKILSEVNLSEEEKEAIKARIELLKNPGASELDLDCENQNCPYC